LTDQDKAVLRARDFWAALVLIAVSLFFLWRTTFIPMFGNSAGVGSSGWYSSAAIVPFGIFVSLLVLAAILLVISIRDGGAERAVTSVGLGWNRAEAVRVFTIMVILFFYIFGLVPRVDFILCSGLLITALIFGYYGGHGRRMILSAAAVALAGAVALVLNPAQADWNLHGDDWVTLAIWVVLSIIVLTQAAGERVLRAVPVIAVLVPTVLVYIMAFGFRQNVPARGGLIFSKIEYHYYVTIRPLWRNG
jgi:hypothetical protein